MKSALAATAEKRGSAELLRNAEKVLSDIHDSRDMQALWDNYRKKFSYASDISWEDINRSVRQLAIDTELLVQKQSILEQLRITKAQPTAARKTTTSKRDPQR